MSAATGNGPVVDLIAFGTVFLEIVFGHVPALPRPGEEIYANEFAVSCGGGALTVASAASRAGARTGLAAQLGDDLGSCIVEEHCRAAGVDLSPACRVPGRVAGISVVLNFDGDRAFVSYLPPRHRTEPPDTARWLDVLRRYRPAWCYLHGRAGARPVLAAARSLGVRVALDVSLNDIDADAGAVAECTRMADVFLPNSEELLRLTRCGTLEHALATAVSWCPCVVVKRGHLGAVVAGPDGSVPVTAGLRQVEVRDRTGAGDAFAGAFVAALCRGASEAQAAAAGNDAGSATVSVLGAVGEVKVDGLT